MGPPQGPPFFSKCWELGVLRYIGVMGAMSRAKKLSFYAIGAMLFALLIEMLSFTFGAFFAPKMFSSEDEYFAAVRPSLFEQWKTSPLFDAELGWNNPRQRMTETKQNCLGHDVRYTYGDEQRGVARPGVPAVALFGDSYTAGAEVDDDSTMSAALERIINAPVVNFGFGASGPDQSVLKFERLASGRKMPKLAILVITHENIRRVVNSFRSVLVSGIDTPFSLKPYIAGDAWVKAKNVASYDEFLAEAKRRFKQDFWATPRFAFPYSISLFRAVTSNSFYYRNIASWGRPRYFYEYSTDNPLLTALTTVIDRWRSSVSAAGSVPIILFVPSDARDRGVSADYVKSLNARAGQTFAFEFDDPSMDWDRYNLKRTGACHPSPYGQERIAAFIADKILKQGQSLSALPLRRE